MSERYQFTYVEGSVYSHVVGLVQRHRLPAGDVVLDLGCGYGSMAEPIRDLGLTYVGIDVDPDAVSDLVGRDFEAAVSNLADPSQLASVLDPLLRDRPLAAILALDFLEHITSAPAVLRVLQALSLSNGGAPLVVSIPNATHIDIAAKMLIGRIDYTPTGLLDNTHVVFYSPAHLDGVMAEAGWAEIGRDDFELSRSDQHFPESVAVLAPSTPIRRLLLQIREQAASGAIVNQFVRAYSPKEPRGSCEVPDDRAPFLSVLVRTQGTRVSTFTETMLSLAAQTLQDFEVLVLAHDVDPARLADLHETISWFDDEFRDRVRILRVEGGGRARPLNVGFTEARGEYVAALDDDDVAFAGWVEAFHSGASTAGGSAIRTLVAEQPIESAMWGNVPGYEVQGEAHLTFPARFNLWMHMFENQSPLCGFAFPRSAFTDMGIRFDESLPVVEDWDFLLQAALMYGVRDYAEVTSLYRRWGSLHSSLNIHSSDEWNRSRDKVLAKIDQRTIPLPPGSLSDFHRLYDELLKRRELVDHLVFERNVAREESSARGSEIGELQQQFGELHERLRETVLEREVAREQAERSEQELSRLRSTLSWKLTQPVRGARSTFGRLKRGR